MAVPPSSEDILLRLRKLAPPMKEGRYGSSLNGTIQEVPSLALSSVHSGGEMGNE